MAILRTVKARLWKQVYRAGHYLSYQRGIPVFSSTSNRNVFWDAQADALHDRWGAGEWDFEVLSRIITTQQVRSVLDVGCGSGRLFPLYEQLGVASVLGVDISNRALDIARERFPNTPTACLAIDSVPLPAGAWDLAVSNRVLQHVPRARISRVVERLCSACRLVYVNEVSATDGERESFFLRRYDYERLFGELGYEVVESGMLDNQTYWLFRKRDDSRKQAVRD